VRNSRFIILDFTSINRAALSALPDLLFQWLPDGRIQGHEFTARNPRRDDHHAGSFRINMVTGKWADFAVADVRGGDLISLAAYLANTSQSEAARKIAAMLGLRND
jgi:hypothetical protein